MQQKGQTTSGHGVSSLLIFFSLIFPSVTLVLFPPSLHPKTVDYSAGRVSWFRGNFSLITQEQRSVQLTDGSFEWSGQTEEIISPEIPVHTPKNKNKEKDTGQQSASSGLNPLTVSLFWRGEENKLKETRVKKKIQIWILTRTIWDLYIQRNRF